MATSSVGRHNSKSNSTGNRASVGRQNAVSSTKSQAKTTSKSSSKTFSSTKDSKSTSAKSAFGRTNAGSDSTGNRASVGRQNAAKSAARTESKAPQKGTSGGKKGYGQSKTDTSGIESVFSGIAKGLGAVFGLGGDDESSSKKVASAASNAQASIKGLKGTAAKNANIVRNALKEDGYDDQAIAGFLGRVQQESGFDPTAIRKNDAGPGKHSYGIGQWNRTRLSALKNFAKAEGGDYSDIGIQARFMAKELRESPDERLAYNAMRSAKTFEDGAVAGMHYERPADYTSKNPKAGHGWKNTLRNARNFASSTFADASDAESNDNPFSAVLGKAVSFFGGEDDDSSTQTAFRDPAVTTVAGEQARASGDGVTVGEDGVKRAAKTSSSKRTGIAGITQSAEAGDVMGVIKGVLGAVTNPVGLAIDTVEDIGRNGVISGGGGSALASMGGSQSNPFPYSKDGGNMTPKPAAKPTEVAAKPEDALPPALGELLFASGRKPFWWSTMT